MIDTYLGSSLSTENTRSLNKAISSAVSAMHAGQRNLASYGKNSTLEQRVSANLLALTFEETNINIRVGQNYISLDFSQFPAWTENPIKVGAASFHVTEEIFIEWLLLRDEERRNYPVRCGYQQCKMISGVSCNMPQRLAIAKRMHSEGAWICARHHQKAWLEEGRLSIDLMKILHTVWRVPGIVGYRLAARPTDVKFLCSAGFLMVNTIKKGSSQRHAYTITEAGMDCLCQGNYLEDIFPL